MINIDIEAREWWAAWSLPAPAAPDKRFTDADAAIAEAVDLCAHSVFPPIRDVDALRITITDGVWRAAGAPITPAALQQMCSVAVGGPAWLTVAHAGERYGDEAALRMYNAIVTAAAPHIGAAWTLVIDPDGILIGVFRADKALPDWAAGMSLARETYPLILGRRQGVGFVTCWGPEATGAYRPAARLRMCLSPAFMSLEPVVLYDNRLVCPVSTRGSCFTGGAAHKATPTPGAMRAAVMEAAALCDGMNNQPDKAATTPFWRPPREDILSLGYFQRSIRGRLFTLLGQRKTRVPLRARGFVRRCVAASSVEQLLQLSRRDVFLAALYEADRLPLYENMLLERLAAGLWS